MKKIIQYQLPFVIWAAFIFWLSSLSKLPHVTTPIVSADKFAHVLVFFVLCWFSHRAFFFQNAIQFFKRWSLTSAFFITCLYGYLDEVHQLNVPNRTYDLLDLLADAIGALFYVVLFTVLTKYRTSQNRVS